MKNYLLLLFTFLLIVGCDQERKKQEFQLQKVEKELDSVSKVMETFGPDLMLKDVTMEVNEIKCEMHDIKNMLTQLLDK